MSTSRPASVSDALDQIEEMNQIAREVLLDPQRRIWDLMVTGLNSREITEVLNSERPQGYAPYTEQNVRYHRAQAQIAVREKYTDYKQGRFRCAIVVERGDDALYQTDQTAEQAIKRADRTLRKAA